MTTATTKKGQRPDSLTLKPSEVASAIRHIANTKVSMFVWGPPGISKSATAQQVATAENMAFIDVRLSQMDPTDLRGIPYPDANDEGGVRWSAPIVFPRDLDVNRVASVEAVENVIKFRNLRGSNKIYYVTKPNITVKAVDPTLKAELVSQELDRFVVVLKNKNGVLVEGKVHYIITGAAKAILALEEFNSAPPSVQAAAYQLVLDRSLGEYEVPDGVTILAMGNRDTDKGITYKMPTPVMNRFVHTEMRHDFDDWWAWALTHNVNPEVIGFLMAFKQKLFQFEPSTAARGFPTPRSWTFVSDILNNNDDMPEQVALGLVTGAVGDGDGIEFMEFRKIASELPRVEHILDGTLKKMKDTKTEVALAYALTTTLCFELTTRQDNIRKKNGASWLTCADRKKWLQEADNFMEFVIANFPPEICIMGIKAAIQHHKLMFEPTQMKQFKPFVDKYKSVIMGGGR